MLRPRMSWLNTSPSVVSSAQRIWSRKMIGSVRGFAPMKMSFSAIICGGTFPSAKGKNLKEAHKRIRQSKNHLYTTKSALHFGGLILCGFFVSQFLSKYAIISSYTYWRTVITLGGYLCQEFLEYMAITL